MANIDEELMGRQTVKKSEEDEAAKELRRGQAKDRNPEAFSPVQEELTRNQQMARARMAEEAKKKKSPATDSSASPAATGSATILKAAWLNVIDSFGATLLYINFHWFGNAIVGNKILCDLGEEWIPAELKKGPSMEFIKSKIKMAGTLEKIIIITVDAIVLVGILFSLAVLIVVFRVYFSFWIEVALKIMGVLGITIF